MMDNKRGRQQLRWKRWRYVTLTFALAATLPPLLVGLVAGSITALIPAVIFLGVSLVGSLTAWWWSSVRLRQEDRSYTYYLYDGQSNTAALTDSSTSRIANTYQYDLWGKVTGKTGSTRKPYQFGGAYGAYTDSATGLLKIGTRYYDSNLCRWTQPAADSLRLSRHVAFDMGEISRWDQEGSPYHRLLADVV